jgi:hypothetical protein
VTVFVSQIMFLAHGTVAVMTTHLVLLYLSRLSGFCIPDNRSTKCLIHVVTSIPDICVLTSYLPTEYVSFGSNFRSLF